MAKLLNDLGYRTRNASLFSDTTIDRLLRDSTAKGVRLVDGKTVESRADYFNGNLGTSKQSSCRKQTR